MENSKPEKSVYIFLKLENPTEEKGCFLFPGNLTIHREP